MNDIQKDELLLAQIIYMFQAAALQQMGKIKNPMTDKIERNIDQAELTIDILDIIFRKMKGNLTSTEDKMFSEVLKELKLNFVDEKAKGPDQPNGEQKE